MTMLEYIVKILWGELPLRKFKGGFPVFEDEDVIFGEGIILIED